MSSIDTYAELQKLPIEEYNILIGQIKYKLTGVGGMLGLLDDLTIKSQLPATIAIRTPTDEAKEWVRQANRALLPQKDDLSLKDTTRKVFSIKVDNQLRSVRCIYKRAKPETVKMLESKGMLVITEHNASLIECARQYPELFDICFIRRRAQDSRWYLMLQIQEKNG